MRTILIIASVVGMVLTACGVSSGQTDEALTIVATTTILGDVVSQIAGDDANVEVLMPIGVDPHDFQASSRQVASLNQADLVVANGLGLEGGLQDVLRAAEADGARVIYVGPALSPIPRGVHNRDNGGQGAEDPHVWMDPVRMTKAVALIASELRQLDGGVDWGVRAEAYADELAAADWELTALFTGVPTDARKLVTNHDSMGYLADRYGFEVVGVLLPGDSTLGTASSRELSELVRVIEAEGVPAIFAETTQPAVLAEAVAAEIGHPVEVVELYTGSLGEPGSGAENLLGMLRVNAHRIAGALRG